MTFISWLRRTRQVAAASPPASRRRHGLARAEESTDAMQVSRPFASETRNSGACAQIPVPSAPAPGAVITSQPRSLPPELWDKIASYASSEARLNLRLVSRMLRPIASDPKHWASFNTILGDLLCDAGLANHSAKQRLLSLTPVGPLPEFVQSEPRFGQHKTVDVWRKFAAILASTAAPRWQKQLAREVLPYLAHALTKNNVAMLFERDVEVAAFVDQNAGPDDRRAALTTLFALTPRLDAAQTLKVFSHFPAIAFYSGWRVYPNGCSYDTGAHKELKKILFGLEVAAYAQSPVVEVLIQRAVAALDKKKYTFNPSMSAMAMSDLNSFAVLQALCVPHAMRPEIFDLVVSATLKSLAVKIKANGFSSDDRALRTDAFKVLAKFAPHLNKKQMSSAVQAFGRIANWELPTMAQGSVQGLANLWPSLVQGTSLHAKAVKVARTHLQSLAEHVVLAQPRLAYDLQPDHCLSLMVACELIDSLRPLLGDAEVEACLRQQQPETAVGTARLYAALRHVQPREIADALAQALVPDEGGGYSQSHWTRLVYLAPKLSAQQVYQALSAILGHIDSSARATDLASGALRCRHLVHMLSTFIARLSTQNFRDLFERADDTTKILLCAFAPASVTQSFYSEDERLHVQSLQAEFEADDFWSERDENADALQKAMLRVA